MNIPLLIWTLLLLVPGDVFGATWSNIARTQLAAIKPPVVDVFIRPYIQTNIPYSPKGAPDDGTCSRAHQMLAHEVVTIVDTKDALVCFACSNLVYGFDEQSGIPLNTFWTHRDNLLFLDEAPQQILAALPSPQSPAASTIVLTLPWNKYSFGTRFVRSPSHDCRIFFGALQPDFTSNMHRVIKIPRSHARITLTPTNSTVARQLFLKTAYGLIAHAAKEQKNGIIPYTWGGSSYIHASSAADQFLSTQGWQRPKAGIVCTGFDCSELIFRLAQTSNISYYAKTAHAVTKLMPQLRHHEALQPGDIIWFPGHVMIIGNVEKNEIIEARGYESGHGDMHTITLAECFARIKNYADFRKAYIQKESLDLLTKDGYFQKTIPEFKIFKLMP